MITLITGNPSSGKTLYAIKQIEQAIKDNPNRPIYANITGINGVQPAPNDWRDTPDGALIVYDDCHLIDMFSQNRKQKFYGAVSDLAIHRHANKDILLTIPAPSLLHGDVLAFIGKHIHLDRRFGDSFATIYDMSKYTVAQSQ